MTDETIILVVKETAHLIFWCIFWIAMAGGFAGSVKEIVKWK